MDPSEQKILQKHLARFIIGDIFNTITESDILKVLAPNVWEHKGKRLSEGQVKALKAEAQAFRQSGLWQILKSELLWLAQNNGFVKSKTEYDQVAAKMLQHLTNVLDDKLELMGK